MGRLLLTIAFAIARRSVDPSTKHGCVIVSMDNRLLSAGYNGPIKGANDENLLTSRPQKYYLWIHAEENALLAYSGAQQDIVGSRAYVTGHPCHKCLRMMIQRGLSRVVFCETKSTESVMMTEEEKEACRLVLGCRGGFILESISSDGVVSNASALLSHVSGRTR